MTVTAKLPMDMFPSESVAEQCTVVVPMGKVSPELWSHDAATSPSTASLAETAKGTGAPFAFEADVTMLAGSDSTGGVVSVVRKSEKYGPIPPNTPSVSNERVIAPMSAKVAAPLPGTAVKSANRKTSLTGGSAGPFIGPGGVKEIRKACVPSVYTVTTTLLTPALW